MKNYEKNSSVTFDFIYKEHYQKVLNYIRSRVNGKLEISQELTNDVFLQVNKHIENYDINRAKFATWLYNIANNKVIDYYRANKHAGNITHVDGWVNEHGKETFEFISTSYNDSIYEGEKLYEVKKAMECLNKREHSIAVLYFMEDRQYNDIAETLEIPMGSVKATINRIRTKLQKKLHSYVMA